MIVDDLNNIQEWVNNRICSKVKCLIPYDEKTVKTYKPEYMHPKAIPMLLPPRDFSPKEYDHNIPSIVVQLMQGEDTLAEDEERYQIRLVFCTWNPGSFQREDDKTIVIKNMNGWEDSIRLIDIARNAIKHDVYIDGLRLDKTIPIQYGQFFEDGDARNESYPYWFSWLTFTLIKGVKTQTNTYDEYL